MDGMDSIIAKALGNRNVCAKYRNSYIFLSLLQFSSRVALVLRMRTASPTILPKYRKATGPAGPTPSSG